jgi:hypothetical protein
MPRICESEWNLEAFASVKAHPPLAVFAVQDSAAVPDFSSGRFEGIGVESWRARGAWDLWIPLARSRAAKKSESRCFEMSLRSVIAIIPIQNGFVSWSRGPGCSP